MRKYLAWLCGFGLLTFTLAYAQDITASLSTANERPLVGEPVHIELLVTLPADAMLSDWPEFPPAWDAFEVQTVNERETSQINGSTVYRQTMEVILWKPGEFHTPPLNIDYQLAGAVTQTEIMLEPLVFNVQSVLRADDNELRPFKAQIELPFLAPQVVIIGLCILVSLLWWAILWWRKRQEQRSMRALYNIRGVDEALLAALQAIDQQVLEPAAIYALTANLLRDYVRDQFHVPAQELTTRELMRTLHQQLSPPMHQRLQQILAQADLVKFARQQPDQQAARQYLEAAAHWIDATAQDLARRKEAA